MIRVGSAEGNGAAIIRYGCVRFLFEAWIEKISLVPTSGTLDGPHASCTAHIIRPSARSGARSSFLGRHIMPLRWCCAVDTICIAGLSHRSHHRAISEKE